MIQLLSVIGPNIWKNELRKFLKYRLTQCQKWSKNKKKTTFSIEITRNLNTINASQSKYNIHIYIDLFNNN